MTTNLSVQHGFVGSDGTRIAYDVVGEGPLIVLSPGMADTRAAYRFLAPLLAAAGHRVASVDLRGHGGSDAGRDSYTHADTANDLLDVVRALGGPAVLVGQSFSAGAVTIAATTAPDLVTALVEIGPFTRPVPFDAGAMFRNDHDYRRGGLRLARWALTGSGKAWAKYLDVAYPGRKPADWDTWLAALLANLAEPGRMKAARTMVKASATLQDAGRRLADVHCPTLVVMGAADSDFADPRAEAEGIVGTIPAGLGQVRMIEHAGHYPHAEYPGEVADAVVSFLADHRA